MASGTHNPARLEWSAREREVLDLIARGRTNGEIAGQLEISFATAKWHVSELITKLGVSSREEVAEYWQRERSLRRSIGRLMHAVVGLSALKVAAGGATVAGLAVVGGAAWAAFAGANASPDARVTAAAASQATATPTPTPTPTPAAGKIYTVVSGDTLSGIAAANGTTLDAIQALNPGITPQTPGIGTVLRLPTPPGGNATRSPTPQLASTATPQPGGTASASTTPQASTTPASGKIYSVVSGDTLSGIAAANGTTLDAIQVLNPGITPQTLGIGTVLRLP